jgi:alpha-1,6-mannosyltransferase
LLSAAGYLAATLFVQSDNTTHDFLLYLAIFGGVAALWGIALRRAAQGLLPPLSVIIGFAVLFRLLLLPAGYSRDSGQFQRQLLYDDDVWRYLWEGHVWSAGVNPMQTAPAALEEYRLEDQNPDLHHRIYNSKQWGDVFDNIGYRDIASPYPYVAQALFRLSNALAPASVLGWKLIVMAFDLASIVLLWKLAARYSLGPGMFAVLAYAWNPLVIKEFAGSGHMDAVLVFFLLAAMSLPASWGSVSLAAAVLVKPVPLLLLPAFYRRGKWKALLAPLAALALFIYSRPRGLFAYAASWEFNSALFRLLPSSRTVAMTVAGVILSALVAYFFWKDDGSDDALSRQAVWLFGAFLLLTPMFAPWYLTWLLPFAALRRSWFWLVLSGTIFLAYHAYLNLAESPALVIAEFGLPFLFWFLMRIRSETPQERADDMVSGKTVLALSGITGALGGLCCLTPIVLVLFGLANVSMAASFGDVLYGEYRWAFRLFSLSMLGLSLVLYFRKRGVCSLSDVKRRRNWVINISLLVLVSSATAYIFWTYVVLQYWGIAAGLPWAQYDESWAIPSSAVLAVIATLLFLVVRKGAKSVSK